MRNFWEDVKADYHTYWQQLKEFLTDYWFWIFCVGVSVISNPHTLSLWPMIWVYGLWALSRIYRRKTVLLSMKPVEFVDKVVARIKS